MQARPVSRGERLVKQGKRRCLLVALRGRQVLWRDTDLTQHVARIDALAAALQDGANERAGVNFVVRFDELQDVHVTLSRRHELRVDLKRLQRPQLATKSEGLAWHAAKHARQNST